MKWYELWSAIEEDLFLNTWISEDESHRIVNGVMMNGEYRIDLYRIEPDKIEMVGKYPYSDYIFPSLELAQEFYEENITNIEEGVN